MTGASSRYFVRATVGAVIVERKSIGGGETSARRLALVALHQPSLVGSRLSTSAGKSSDILCQNGVRYPLRRDISP